MSGKRIRPRRVLKLNEIIEELHNADDDIIVPSFISILPPDNANSEITDEDSGDENIVNLHNLPGSQLRAEAEIFYNDSSSDEEDNMPLSHLAKKRCVVRNETNISDSSVASTSTDMPSTSTATPRTSTTVPKNQKYTWRNRHNPKQYPQWQNDQAPKYLQPPMYYYEAFVNKEIIELLVRYTNIYAQQKNKTGNITEAEMKCFLGILLYSGYIVVPRKIMYWEKSTDTNFPLIYNAMSRDRFSFIMSHIHCCDNTLLQEQNDKFAKVRPLFDLLNNTFLRMAPLEEVYSIDEAMVPYYGGHGCKQFIRGKPIRWGYKFWVGSTRLGYVLWFDPYQGRSATSSAYNQHGLGGNVILQFTDVLQSLHPDLSFHLYFDNFFSSIPLFHELSNKNIKATGTIRENRTAKCPLPTNNEFKKTERGTFQFKSSHPANILVCKWNDNSVVTVASNVDNVEPLHKAKRFSQQQKKYILIDQPTVIKKYNENMGGVDRSPSSTVSIVANQS